MSLTQTPASQLAVGDRVCGDWGRTFVVADVKASAGEVLVTWDNGCSTRVWPAHAFYVETAAASVEG